MDPDQVQQMISAMSAAILTGMQQSQAQFLQQLQQQQSAQQQAARSTPAGTVASNLTLMPNFENFIASKESFKQYRHRFENYLKMKNVSTDKEMCRHLLINSIGAEGYKVLCSVAAPNDPSMVDYDTLIAKIEQHLCPKVNILVEQHRFFNCVQGAKQSIAEFAAMLKLKIIDCKFGAACKCECKCDDKVADALLRVQFIRGLVDTYTREQLLKIKDPSFQAVVDEAMALEASREQSKELGSTKSSIGEPINRISRKTDHSDNNRNRFHSNSRNNYQRSRSKSRINYRELGIESLCVRCGRDNHKTSDCRAKVQSLKCSSCNKNGHVAKVCITTLLTKKKEVKQANSTTSTNFVDMPTNLLDSTSPSDFFGINLIIDLFRTCEYNEADLAKYYVDIQIGENFQTFEVDSGTAFTLIPEADFKKLKLNIKICSTSVRFRSYTQDIFEPLGIVKVPVSHQGRSSSEIMFIVPSSYPALLGRAWIRHLGINLQEIDCQSTVKAITPVFSIDPVADIFQSYAELFQPVVANARKVTSSIQLRKNAKPVFIRARQIPHALFDKANAELDLLEKQGVLEPIQISDWGSPLVVIPKPDGGVRLCVDYKVSVNPQLVDAHYPIPKVEDVLNSLRGSNYFCQLDLFKAYLHIPVDKESQLIQAISTHRGVYLMKRLSQGIKTAPFLFNRIIDQILQGLEGVTFYFDDIVIHGPSKESCYNRLLKVLDRLKEYNFHLNAQKCKFFKTEISYLGYVVKNNQILKDSRKVEAIQNTERPKNQSELKTFLGLVTYYSRFIPQLSTLTYPLRRLLHKDQKWFWSSSCESSFIKLRNEIASDRVLVPFDPSLPVTLACDASPVGIAGVLSHIIDGVERPIAFVSRSLSKAEANYSQIDREALAIVFAVDKFFNYLYGRKFKLITDNRPLTRIFHQNAKIPPMTAGRLLRYAVFLSAFDYEIEHRKATDHQNVDYLSRAPSLILQSTSKQGIESSIDEEVTLLYDQVINQISTLKLTFEEIAKATAADPDLSMIKTKLLDGTCINTEFSIQDGVIFKGMRTVIPAVLQKLVLEELHHTHIGVVKMKQLARQYCWWKSIDSDIEKLVKSCEQCALIKKSPAKAPTHAWDEPPNNFDRIHIDYAGEYLGFYYLIVVDAKSKWLEVKVLRNAPSSTSTIQLLLDIFSTHGFPKIIVSDNATIFCSSEFQEFCHSNGIVQKFTAPGHPATNGLAERNVQTVKNKLACMSTSALSIPEKVREIVFRYRATPLASGKSPAELYLGRKLRIRLDILRPTPTVAEKTYSAANLRKFQVGDRVQARWYQGNKPTWKFGKVTKRCGILHYEIELDSGYVFKRHIDQLRSTLVQPPNKAPEKHVTFPENPTTEKWEFDIVLPKTSQPDSTPAPVSMPEPAPPEAPSPIPNTVERTPTSNPQVADRPLRNRHPPNYLKDYVSK